ncbi:MAG: excinuclease ABC subunit UvrC [Ruminococcaceae bacterium]|nr:excinuclease ABC subunit UvrC [Oscillospiraceae bacterium]
MAITEAQNRILLDKANALPMRPGVYIMKNAAGSVIYVGKSAKLKSRVSQYFQNSEKNTKTANMVRQVKDFDYYLCDTEMEALSLENTLIKQYTPKYNIRLKDAKSYPYIKLTDEEYPRLVMSRKRQNDKSRYFGPYSGTSTVFSVINTLSGVLGLPTCKRRFPKDIGKERPCLYYQLGRCCGVCTGNVTEQEYAEKIRYAVDVLRGNTSEVKRQLTDKMYECAEQERFETAAKYRDTLSALERLGQKHKVVAAPGTEYDVIALYRDELCACISVFFIRDGAVSDKAEYVFGADRIIDESNITAFLCELYNVREYIPRSILLSFELEDGDRELVADYLSERAARIISLRTPERGELKTLCDMVRDNAKEKARAYKSEAEKDEKTLLRLAELLCLEVYPSRIEAYDISNLGHEHITAGMIVTDGTSFKKRDYRCFKIKSITDGTDDYASMREAIYRRFAHLDDEGGSFSELPDLILLDGGKGHVSVVRDLLRDLEIDVPVFGMVKDDFHKTRALCTESEEISIARENAVFVFIYKIQEEVHRYTVSKMSNAKRKTLTKSSLTKITGIGDSKAKLLLKALGGYSAVKSASVEQLAAIKGISRKDAESIVEYFNEEK